MVKLFCLSVLHKSETKVRILKSAFELSSFGFFQRGTIQEFLGFVSKTMVERTQLTARQSVKEDIYMCHVYVRSDGLAGILVSDHEYPHRVAHTLLMKVLDDFELQVDRSKWQTMEESEVIYSQLPVYLAKYQVPSQADALSKIQGDLDETQIILHNTMEAVLQRGEKLDDMIAKSENLSMQSKAFYKTAKKTNSCCKFG